MSDNPFEAVERLLESPPATGVMVVHVEPGSGPEQAGLRVGDVVTAVEGTSVETLQQLVPLIRGKESDLAFDVTGADGERRTVSVTPPVVGLEGAAVREGEAGWSQSEDEPALDVAPLLAGGDVWLRTWLGESLAGYERLHFEVQDGELRIRTDFHIAGEHEGQGWDYRTRAETHHAADDSLALRFARFHDGGASELNLRGEARASSDGTWSGRRGRPDGTLAEESYRPVCPPTMTPYSAMLLVLAMPRREGASHTFLLSGEGRGRVTRRARFECLGRAEVPVDGEPTPVWTYAWRHYGHSGGEERFHVDDQGELVRIDWGPTYGGCWAERVSRDELGDLPGPAQSTLAEL